LGLDQLDKEKNMKGRIAYRSMVVLALAVLGLTIGFGAGVSSAGSGSPHFFDSRTDLTIQSDGDLALHFKEAGLGNGVTVNYTFDAKADVTCNCVTRSGNCPAASNKVTGTVDVSGHFDLTPRNGSIETTVVLSAPRCPASVQPTCGGGQKLVLSAITYHDVSFTDNSNDLGLDLTQELDANGEISLTKFTCP
jgi:hypothetical protein